MVADKQPFVPLPFLYRSYQKLVKHSVGEPPRGYPILSARPLFRAIPSPTLTSSIDVAHQIQSRFPDFCSKSAGCFERHMPTIPQTHEVVNRTCALTGEGHMRPGDILPYSPGTSKLVSKIRGWVNPPTQATRFALPPSRQGGNRQGARRWVSMHSHPRRVDPRRSLHMVTFPPGTIGTHAGRTSMTRRIDLPSATRPGFTLGN
jgi:hypothetical protein